VKYNGSWERDNHREHNGMVSQRQWRGERDDYRCGKRPIYVDVSDGSSEFPESSEAKSMYFKHRHADLGWNLAPSQKLGFKGGGALNSRAANLNR
jgi:hypothetical protein